MVGPHAQCTRSARPSGDGARPGPAWPIAQRVDDLRHCSHGVQGIRGTRSGVAMVQRAHGASRTEAAGWSAGRFSWGASMGQGATVQQGCGLGNEPRERGGVEAGAHRRSDGAEALRCQRRCSKGSGSSFGHSGALGPAREEGKAVSHGGRTRGLGADEMQRWGSPFIGASTGRDRMARGGG
jgi:hypothetical protein